MHGEFLTSATRRWRSRPATSSASPTCRSKGFEPLAFRYLALTAHYRSKLDFTEDAMHAATSGLARLRRAAAAASDGRCREVDLSAEPGAGYRARFAAAIADDLAMPRALAIAHEVAARPTSRRRRSGRPAARLRSRAGPRRHRGRAPSRRELPAGADGLLERRAARARRVTSPPSDALRDELAALGVEVRDTPDGQEWTIRR